MSTEIQKLIAMLCCATIGVGQSPQSPVKPAAPKSMVVAPKTAGLASNSRIDEVIEMVKGRVPETMIIKQLQKANKPLTLSPADMVKLQKAGVSENIMGALMDPAATPSIPAPFTPVTPNAGPAVEPTSPVAAPASPSTTLHPVEMPPNQSTPTLSSEDAAVLAHAQKKRVIVDTFDFSAVVSKEDAIFGNLSNQNIGKGIRAMFITRAQQGGKVVLVERGEKEKQMQMEQDKNAANRNKQGTGARIGQIQGADAILTGDIIIFGRDDKRTNVRGGGTIGTAIGILNRKNDQDKFVVAISYRLIDAETSEVIASGEERGEAARGGRKTSWKGALGQSMTGMDISTSNSGFERTIQGEATQDCLNKLAVTLDKQATGMKKRVKEVEASVVDVSGGNLTIGAGANESVNIGEVFEIHHVLSILTDPVTKEVLDKKTEKIGEMTVTAVRPKVASGTYVGSTAQNTEKFVAIKKLPPQK